MKKLIGGALVWSVGAVSASAAPLGIKYLSGTKSASLTLSDALDVAAAHPIWGLAILGFGVLGSWLREERKQRAALAYR